MEGWVNQYVRSCDICQRNKSPRHACYGLLQPLDLAPATWISAFVDFITAIPESEAQTQVMVGVDRFTKMAHFVALTENAKATDCANAFLREIWKIHGLSTDLVLDQDAKWTGEFWDGLCQQLGIKKKLSTAFHPQTDGQTERVNQTLETYLRTSVNSDQNNWYQLLPLAEFAYNNSINTATQMTPFYANYDYHARTIWSFDQGIKNPASKI
jgi:transposase InsO family protein